MLLYRDSRDSRVASAGIVVQTGRKWRVQEGLEIAEFLLRYRGLVGTGATGRLGLGVIPQACYNKAQGRNKHHFVGNEGWSGGGKDQEYGWVAAAGSMVEVEGYTGEEALLV